ncbi:MAG TPA: rod shape-determining protein RodA [Bacillota bacterium]|nr:rod shape-determining protein RodA [Bacillota bacterium]
MDRRILKNLDFTLLAVVGALVIIGLVMILSATHANTSLTRDAQIKIVEKQFLAALAGLIIGFLMLFMDYRISDRMSQLLYGLTMVFLILVLTPLGEVRNGAQMGLFGFQPSEFAKVTMIITFGKYLSEKESLQSFYSFIVPALFLGAPLILILLQPDMGTALVFIFFFFIMMYAAGAPGWKLLVLIGAGILLITIVFLGHHFFGTPLPIKEYQLNRLTSFIDPDRDPKGSGWNVRQAVIAVGSGQFFGKGLFRGTQGRLGYLPENYTDFIFAVLCEETGFVGGFLVLMLYFTLIWRGIRIALQARDKTGSMIAVGVVSMFLFHVLENVGMNMGVMPITGIPLPFITYGGSSMMANLLAISLLSSIWARHQKIMF